MNRKADAPETAAATDGRRLIRSAQTATMATISAKSGAPHASLVLVATEPSGAPLILISGLAAHTKNLRGDARVSLLFDGTKGLGDPLEGARITATGHATLTTDPIARRRFLARHPSAEQYADFADFAFYRLDIEVGNFVGGFGRIHEIDGQALLLPAETSRATGAAESDIVAHMNADHADAVELYAVNLLGAAHGPWRFVGCDAEGCDLGLEGDVLRLDFPHPVSRPNEWRQVLATLAAEARARDGAPQDRIGNTAVQ